jgi:FkbM family methyltransferase
MRVQRSRAEILHKASFGSVLQVGRVVRDVRSPLYELSVFLGLREFEENHELRLRSGYRIELRSLVDFRQSFWDCWVRDPYEVRRTDRVIIDAGANIGCFSIYAAAKAPHARIYALEPSRSNYESLEANVRASELETRISTKPFGVAGETGALELDTGRPGPYHTSFRAESPIRERIQVRSLGDALAETVGMQEEVDVFKMDCEGAEMDCLLRADSASLRRIRRIALEYHEWAGFAFSDLQGMLEREGFRLTKRSHNTALETGTSLFERPGKR